ncbi:MAG: heat-shock protein Hsp20 [Verrucomicrobia bacterium]|nr:MAG: heat-shock protein Hsp20 [Verrucomicrobiota bacterium]
MLNLTKWDPFTTTRWDPFRELDDFSNRLSSYFGRSPLRRGDGEETMTMTQWVPAVDVSEDDKEYLIKAELPEIKREDVKVTVENGVLTISGERKMEKEEKDKKYHRVERAYGSYLRSFSLPDDAEGEKVAAEFKDGVLKVHLPKNLKAKPKAIDIKIS